MYLKNISSSLKGCKEGGKKSFRQNILKLKNKIIFAQKGKQKANLRVSDIFIIHLYVLIKGFRLVQIL